MNTDLILKELIASSDDDADLLWSAVSVGFDDMKNFVVELKETINNLDDPQWNGRGKRLEIKYTRAVLDKANTEILCNYLHCNLFGLPAAVRDEFGDDYPNSRASYMKTVFKDISDFLIDAGCQFRIRTEETGQD